jgi:rhombotail lipoprotein
MGEYRQRHTRSTSLVQFLYPDGKLPLTDKRNPILNLPLHVGLAFIPDRRTTTIISPITKNQLLENVKTEFETKEYVDKITIIPQLYLQGNQGYSTLQQIKTLYNLDVIALVSYDQLLNSQENILSLSYLTIVGAYIFHGTDYNVNTLMDLAVVDVDSQNILFRAAGTSTSKNKRVSFAKHKKAFRDKQNQEFEIAMAQMQGNLILALDKFEQRLRNKDANEEIKINYRKGYSGGSVSSLMIAFLLMLSIVKIFNRYFKTK